MANAGRPDKYATHVQPYLDQLPEWYKTMTVRQICIKLGVSKTAFYKYAAEYPELEEILQKCKGDLIEDLRSALKQRALGYTYKETTEKTTVNNKGIETVKTTVERHLPPDLGSIHLLLKNLDPDWHNDDMETLKIKKKELEIKKQRADADDW